MGKESDRAMNENGVSDGPNARLLTVLATLEPLAAEDDFPLIEDQPPEPVEF